MVHKLIAWALDNPLIVCLAAVFLVAFGGYAFLNVNVEAYPDPAPAIVEIIAKYPGASAEEVERQVTIPLEVALAGMPGLQYTRSKSLFGLAHLRNQFNYGVDFAQAKQDVINRLQFVDGLPPGVSPTISPQSPTGEILRYTLKSPKDALGRDVYNLSDLKAQQDWGLERQFRRVPRIIDIVSGGGTVKRYEVQPDPERMVRYGITLDKLQNAIQNSNANVGGDYLSEGENVLNVRGIGLIGGGQDPARSAEVLLEKNPAKAASVLRADEERRIQRIRQIVITSINNLPIRVEDVVEGGPLRYPEDIGKQGVVVGHLPRLGRVAMTHRTRDAEGNEVLDAEGKPIWIDESEKIQGIVLLRKGEASLPALHDVNEKIKSLNADHANLLPGVEIEPYYDRSELIGVTTETVRENLIVGMVLVTVILLMFLSNVRSALIVAINIPLALLFAFSVLFLRGKSANLLSIGAVDFGIIVDSSVIMVENIYRHLSSGEFHELPLKQRILAATKEVEKSLFFTTAIMVCAFLPLFTMKGPEGQIFGPMADTYAFALGGALILALTVAPVLCMLAFKNLQASRENFLVRNLKSRYLKQLRTCLNHRWATLAIMGGADRDYGRPAAAVGPRVHARVGGRQPLDSRHVPDQHLARRGLEESRPVAGDHDPVSGNPPGRVADRPARRRHRSDRILQLRVFRPAQAARRLAEGQASDRLAELARRQPPPHQGRADQRNERFAQSRHRGRGLELLPEHPRQRDGVALGRQGRQFGQDRRARPGSAREPGRAGRHDPGEHPRNQERRCLPGQRAAEPGDSRRPAEMRNWGVSVADVEDVVTSAVGGVAFSQMIEGEKRFDITLRWPEHLRSSEQAILNIPVDVSNNQVTAGAASVPQTQVTGAAVGLSKGGTSVAMPAYTGSISGGTFNNIFSSPRRRLIDLVTPLDDGGKLNPKGRFIRTGASTISREQGNRLIAVKFSVRERDLAGAVSEAQDKTRHIFSAPYTAEWSGEFQEMQEAEHRLMYIVPLSLSLILLILYLAFRSWLDALAVLSNVIALSLGGIWALLLTGTHFSISAAVGFVSLFGVAIMDGLLMISYFNQLRGQGIALNDAIMQGAEKRVRPVMMTALTAILGLLPAALSTRIGAQTQQPLAIVVVGGMISTLFLTRYLMPVLYSFYGHREPPSGSSSMAH